jgi:hypothetical protein
MRAFEVCFAVPVFLILGVGVAHATEPLKLICSGKVTQLSYERSLMNMPSQTQVDVSLIVDLDRRMISGLGRQFTITSVTETGVGFEAPYREGEKYGRWAGALNRISGWLLLGIERHDNVKTRLDLFAEQEGHRTPIGPISYELKCCPERVMGAC